MICLFCRVEKLNADLCPTCGLCEEEAILKAARESRLKNAWGQAAAYYHRYLQKTPGNLEVQKEAVFCSWREALARPTSENMEKAEKEIAEVLSKDWEWEQGHQYRLQLFRQGGRLEEFRVIYLQIAATGSESKKRAEKVLKLAALIEKFITQVSEEKRKIQDGSDWKITLEAFWPLLSGLLFVIFASMFFLNGGYPPKTVYAIFLAGLVLNFFLLIFSLYLYRTVKLKARKKANEKNIGSFGPADLSN